MEQMQTGQTELAQERTASAAQTLSANSEGETLGAPPKERQQGRSNKRPRLFVSRLLVAACVLCLGLGGLRLWERLAADPASSGKQARSGSQVAIFAEQGKAVRRASMDAAVHNAAGQDDAGQWSVFAVDGWQFHSLRPEGECWERTDAGHGYTCVREPVRHVGGEHKAGRGLEPTPLLDSRGGGAAAWTAAWQLVGYQEPWAGEQLSLEGYPLRWQQAGTRDNKADSSKMSARALADTTARLAQMEPRSVANRGTLYSYVVRARGLGFKGPILRHARTVQRYARQYKIPAHLLLAIMQVESGGRQEVVSSKNAMGLMQVQPTTAGMEVHAYLERREGPGKGSAGPQPVAGSSEPVVPVSQQGAGAAAAEQGAPVQAGPASGQLSVPGQAQTGQDALPGQTAQRPALAGTDQAPQAVAAQTQDPAAHRVQAVLSREDQNIRYGAVYLHLLQTSYFGAVTDPEARLLCVLAAYNMGPGRLARLFAADARVALQHINTFSAAGLYQEIKARFDPEGGFTYMDKVITLMLQYKKMGY